MLKFGLIDGIIPEPVGGAHWDYDEAAEMLKEFFDTCDKRIKANTC